MRRPLLSIVPFTTDAPTSPLHQRNRTELIRARLGRIGDEAACGPEHGGAGASIAKVRIVRTPDLHSVAVEAHTRRIDGAGRIKLQLAGGTLSSALGWQAGTLDVAFSDGWAALTQPPISSAHHADGAATVPGLPSPTSPSASACAPPTSPDSGSRRASMCS